MHGVTRLLSSAKTAIFGSAIALKSARKWADNAQCAWLEFGTKKHSKALRNMPLVKHRIESDSARK
ncbi:MAG: hypothetical protein C5B59_09235 [Bacteroidetes bacterium]|nr:MAG: hypothetical protein C5B59_09235 [Bacteroidota bacterium]